MGRVRVAGRLRVVSLVAVVFVTAFDGLALSTLVPQIAVDLHLGGLYGAFTAVYALAQLFGALFVYGRVRSALPLGAALFCLGAAGCAVSPTGLCLVCARFVQGVGGGLAVGGVYASIDRDVDEGDRPVVFAVLASVWVVPSIIGPGLAQLVMVAWSWRALFLVTAVVAAACAALLARASQPGERTSSALPLGTRVVLMTVGALSVATAPFAGRGPVAVVLVALVMLTGLVLIYRAFTLVRPVPVPGTPVRTLATPLLCRGVAQALYGGAEGAGAWYVHGIRPGATFLVVTTGACVWAAASWAQSRDALRSWVIRNGLAVGLLPVVSVAAFTSAVLLGGTDAKILSLCACTTAAGAFVGVVEPIISSALFSQRAPESSTALPVVIQVDDLLVPGVVVAVLGTAMGSAATHALLALLAGLGLLALVTWTASGGLTRHWLYLTTGGRRRADGDAGG